ncbi:alpha/beta hydrolase [Microbacterium sp. Au-Mic1]|uniref:alpha/beta fold hydrolase n=1 Tax=Microbacterium sp. Au-Mic1 TaxID=2906457 RepID=UPI001E5219F0|nr:alpha/beta hydrolase [Microbacterium sp. Au-Mic1]MCE4024388.1 alpha/beta hydrolase [Microbacterium sp. Au-Mic1]
MGRVPSALRIRPRAHGVCAVVVLALLLPACTAGEARPQSSATTTSSATPAAPIAGRFDVGGGRRIYLECRGSGPATVVLIGGLRAAADYWNRTDTKPITVMQGIGESARVCAYDRPGTVREGNAFSRSDPIPQPSSERSAVADLHALLAAADVHGPFVLVGHSYGGCIARLYASTYPDQVTGMVLVDALSEAVADAMSPEQYAQLQTSQQVPPEDIAAYPGIERLDSGAVNAELRTGPPIRPMPLTVLSADRLIAPQWQAMIDSGQLPPGTPSDLGAAVDKAQQVSQAFQAHLVPGAVHITDTHSGHDIPLDNPVIVIDAIRDVVARTR